MQLLDKACGITKKKYMYILHIHLYMKGFV